MSKPLKLHIVEQARSLIADEQHWCRGHLAQHESGMGISPTSDQAVKRCALGALIAAAYQFTHNLDAAYHLGHHVLRPIYGSATLIYVNDMKGHAAVLSLFDEAIGAHAD